MNRLVNDSQLQAALYPLIFTVTTCNELAWPPQKLSTMLTTLSCCVEGLHFSAFILPYIDTSVFRILYNYCIYCTFVPTRLLRAKLQQQVPMFLPNPTHLALPRQLCQPPRLCQPSNSNLSPFSLQLHLQPPSMSPQLVYLCHPMDQVGVMWH